jgi:hypothetical protein
MACYTSLMAAAQDLGDQEMASACQQILREEQAMADFLFSKSRRRRSRCSRWSTRWLAGKSGWRLLMSSSG